jgi:hypothetical protein
MFPSFGTLAIPLVLLVLFMLFGFCVIPIRL